MPLPPISRSLLVRRADRVVVVISAHTHRPILFAVLALVASMLKVWRIRRLMPAVHALRQGRDGERIVRQALEELRADGARIFHDVPADGFNLLVDPILSPPRTPWKVTLANA
jgi:hypothetical protein